MEDRPRYSLLLLLYCRFNRGAERLSVERPLISLAIDEDRGGPLDPTGRGELVFFLNGFQMFAGVEASIEFIHIQT